MASYPPRRVRAMHFFDVIDVFLRFQPPGAFESIPLRYPEDFWTLRRTALRLVLRCKRPGTGTTRLHAAIQPARLRAPTVTLLLPFLFSGSLVEKITQGVYNTSLHLSS